MASKNRHSADSNSARRPNSPAPDYFVDLTVDSPVQRRTVPHRRPSVLRLSQNAESSHGTTIHVVDVDTVNVDAVDCSNRLLPPKKRARKEKTVKVDKIEHVEALPGVNDSISGESTVLLCPVCLEDLSSKRKPTSTRCGHIYCAECIEKILKSSKKCPKCQHSITQKSCIRIYF